MTEVPPRPNRPVYLDYQATTPCDPRVVAAMLPFFSERFGNPHSSEHGMGWDAEAVVKVAREQVAGLIGAEGREVIFTSGATESNNVAIKGAARFAMRQGDPRRRIVTLTTEHKCVLESVRDLAEEGFEAVFLPVRPDGLLDLDMFADALRTPTLLVSVMAVNNETGVVQDIPRIAAIAREAGALVHSDLAQAAGKILVDVASWGVSLASVSAHKLYGPKGVGALYVRRRPRMRLEPLFSGGGQERGVRSGTLPTPLIVGFGEACRISAAEMAEEANRLAGLRDRLLGALGAGVPGLEVNGSVEARIPGNLNLRFPGATGPELMERTLGLCVSTGSACSSASVEPSYVLRAMGLSDDAAERSLRIGLGRFTSVADIDYAGAALAAAHAGEMVPA
jgi:cysteine desulfurase